MLGDKHRMSAHRGLLAVVRNARGRQPPGDKVRRVLVDNFRALIITVLPFFHAEAKTGAKSGTLQAGKQAFDWHHQNTDPPAFG